MILVITEASRDAHLAPVLAELLRRGHEVRVFDPGTWLTGAEIVLEGSARGQRCTLRWGSCELALDDVRSVWYRRPGSLVVPEALAPGEREWLDTEMSHLSTGLWSCTDAFWVSDPARINRASRKLPQLRLAAELGLDLPPYLVTNSVDAARQFVDAQPDGTIVKVLSKPTLMADGLGGRMYTRLLDDNDLELLPAVAHAPTFLQAFVPKKYDLRITVFGDRLFAVAIDSRDFPAAHTDFRNVRAFELPHHPVQLPAAVESACIEMVRRLGLQYGAIDIVQTPDDRYLFLEINPNGQFYWLEMTTGLPLAAALCDLLERGGGLHGTPPPPQVVTADAPSRILDLGRQTVALSAADAAHFAARPGSLPQVASRVWVEDFSGEVAFHFGDFAD